MRKWATACTLLGSLGFLGWFSFHLASIRIFQVDECGNVFVARYLAMGEALKLGGSIDLFQYLLSFLAHGTVRSLDLLLNARFLMLEVFWLNLVLIALATGEKLFSLRGLFALVGAATLAPIWDYGFEVRHDNLVLTIVLLTWCTVRTASKTGPQAYLIVGALVVIAQFLASKSFVYTLPISALILVSPPPQSVGPRWKLISAWTVGAITAFLFLFLLYRSAGLWHGYLDGGRNMSALAGKSTRLAPWFTLTRLLTQTPLLVALVVAAATTSITALVARGRAALTWHGYLPEAALFGVSLTALFINPSPYPYNLLHLAPYAFLFAWRYCALARKNLLFDQTTPTTLVSVIVFTHLAPFWIATWRHTRWLNYRQERVMSLAEKMTDPKNDPVYDAIGMLPTRPIVDRRSLLHGLSIDGFLTDSGLHLRDMWAANPPAVFIPNYRTDWLTDEDHDFIHDRYVPLADDFWVLGKTLPSGGGAFEVFHAGRYRISTLKGSDLADTYPVGFKGALTPEDPGTLTGTLDGVPLSNRPVELSIGTHHIDCAPDCQPAVVWMGPHLERVHRIGPGNHLLLFYNWY